VRAVRFSFFLSFLTLFTNMQSTGQTLNEYQVKAVFLYNFTTFVEWPKTSFADAKAPFVIGIIGENVFQRYLEEVVEGEKVNGHPITIRYVRDVAGAKDCQILFVSNNSGVDFKSYARQMQKNPVLTVSDDASFMESGGMIFLYNEANKIRLLINDNAAENAGLTISSKLLRLATLYKKK
jgi:hypothetical protein